MDDGAKQRDGSPPKQKEQLALKQNPIVTKTLKNLEIMKNHDASWLEAIKVFIRFRGFEPLQDFDRQMWNISEDG